MKQSKITKAARIKKTNGIIKKILFIELILLFSFASSFLISAIMKEKREKMVNTDSTSRQRYLFKNFRLLNFFLKLDLDFDKKTGPDETAVAAIAHPLSSDLVNLEKAETLLQEGNADAALQVLEQTAGTYEIITQKKEALQLRYLYAQERYDDFINSFDATPRPLPDPELQLLLLDCLLKTDRSERAFKIFRELHKTRGLNHFKKTIPAKDLNRLLNQLTDDDWYRKLYFLAENNRFREFLREKRYVKDTQLVNLIYAEFYYRRGQYTRSQKLLKQVDSEKLQNHKKKILIKIELRRSGPDEILQKVETVKGDQKIYAELLFDTATLLLIHGETELSAKLFSRFMKAGSIAARDLYKALWLSAWLNYRMNQKKRAIEHFERGARSHIVPYKIANRYWLYKLKKTNPQTLEEYPFSYYYTRIAGEDGEKPKTSKNFTHLISGPTSKRFSQTIRDLETLLAHNLIDQGLTFVQWTKNDQNLASGEQNMLKIIESILYLKQGNFYKAFTSFRSNFPRYHQIVLPRPLSQVYMPIKYRHLIEKYARVHRLDPLLIMALIREETMFKPDAVSPARALGLMQLLLSTARKVAPQEGIKQRIYRHHLFDPELNIRLGTRYFRILLDKYDGQMHLALAAYNAGDHRVDRWLEQFGQFEPEAFIEMIPFSDTRSYVKNIFRNLYYYRYYYGD